MLTDPDLDSAGANDATDEAPVATSHAVPELTRLMVLLLKGVLYRDDDEPLWSTLLRLQARVREQAGVLLLDLVLDEAEGYAFLRSRPEADESDGAPALPRLIPRRPLGYQTSLLLALLRKRLAEFDAEGGETRLVLTRDAIVDLLRVFLPGGSNEARLMDQVDVTIGKAAGLGFLRRLKPADARQAAQGPYEVRRILKAFIDAEWLVDFDARLEAYRVHLQSDNGPEAPDA